MSGDRIDILVDGIRLEVPAGSTVAAAILAGTREPPRSWTPLCGMGICWGCHATIDGRRDRRACQVEVAPGMTISLDRDEP